MLRLRRPQVTDKLAIEEMLADYQAHGSNTDGFWFRQETFDYEVWLKDCDAAEQGLGLPDGAVPYIQYVSFDDKNRAIGFLNLRLRLNERLRQYGGHIGYSIRPSERRKGYAKEQLALGLAVCLTKNIKQVLVTCSVTNEASRRTILAQGGVLADRLGDTERYWIDLEVADEQSQTAGMEE